MPGVALRTISVVCYFETLGAEEGGEVETLSAKPDMCSCAALSISRNKACAAYFAFACRFISLFTLISSHRPCNTAC